MRKIRYILLVCLFFVFTNVKAIETCSSDELKRLNELASNVEFKYNYEIVDEYITQNELEVNYATVEYKLNILNHTDDLKYMVLVGNNEFYLDINALDQYKFLDGDKLTIKIYSYTNDLCTDTLLKTIKLNIPYYNQYYYRNKEKCQSNLDFKYCKEFLDKELKLSDSEINLELNRENGVIILDEDINQNDNLTYIILTTIITVIIVTIVFVFYYRNYRKNKL